jgi:hypothetical protein
MLSAKGSFAFYFLYAWFSKKKTHNMLALMLDPRYKNMCLVTTYLGCEVVATLVADYDE